MKNIILTIAIVLVCAILIVGQNDVTMLQREGYKAKNLTDEMAAAATLTVDLQKYSEGYIVFDYSEGCNLARDILKVTGSYDDNYISTGGYFHDPAEVEIFFFDQSEICKHYVNGEFKPADNFSFHFSDKKKISEYLTSFEGEDYVIEYPCACVIYHAGRPTIRASFISGLTKVTKKSIYEYKY